MFYEKLSATHSKLFWPSCKFGKCYILSSLLLCVCLSSMLAPAVSPPLKSTQQHI